MPQGFKGVSASSMATTGALKGKEHPCPHLDDGNKASSEALLSGSPSQMERHETEMYMGTRHNLKKKKTQQLSQS
jgi:hypothetical protein